MMQEKNVAPGKLVRPEDLPSYGIKLGDRQRRRLEAAGLFPRRVPITSRSHGYVEDEILAYTESKIAVRDDKKEKPPTIMKTKNVRIPHWIEYHCLDKNGLAELQEHYINIVFRAVDKPSSVAAPDLLDAMKILECLCIAAIKNPLDRFGSELEND